MGMEILLSEFNKLPVEKRAQIALKNYCNPKENIIENDVGTFMELEPFADAWAYLEDKGYAELVGGTPKSRAAYHVTPEGIEFKNKNL